MSMRITGMASGLDIDSLVKEMMKARKASSDKLFQKRTTLEWQQETYREVSTKIVDFRNNKLSSYSLSNQINAKKAEISGNQNALTVNSVSSTAAGSLNVQVTKVATAATSVFTYDPDNNPATTNSTDGMTLSSLGFTSGTLTVNGKAVTYAGTDTLQNLADKINADKDTKATALYDKVRGQFSITNTETGGGTASITGFPESTTTFVRANSGGDNATAVINGITYTQSSNKFSVNGIDFTVKQESGAAGATTLTTVTDTDKILSTIKSFVSDYNSLIDKVNGELNEERFRSFTPLTDVQKEEMSDKQVELWEEKARSGLLRNDSILSKFASDMRIASTADFAANVNIATIGITTGTWQDRGKLVIDEEKLRKAITDNPQLVADIFTKAGDASQPGNANVGIFNKMTKIAMDTLTQLSERAGTSAVSADPKGKFLESSLSSGQIREYKTKESDMLAKLTEMENRYYKQFAAMEAAINKFNSQASSLSSFMS